VAENLARVVGEEQLALGEGEDVLLQVEALMGQINAVRVPVTGPAPGPTADAPPAPMASEAAPPQASTTAPMAAERSAPAETGTGPGWRIDVFWCAGPGAEGHRAAAQRLNRLLTTQQGSGAATPLMVGRARLREMTVEANARPGYRLRGSFISAHPSERAAVTGLQTLMARGGEANLSIRPTRSVTPDYLSVFFCENAQPPG
jgi:hypothetical protein